MLITSGDASGEKKKVKRDGGFTASSGTLTVDSAFSAQIATGVTYELHRWDPGDIDNAIRAAARLVYPHLYLPIRDESLVIDGLLLNNQFETFSGGFTRWTEVGSPTVTAETTIVWHGTNSAKIVASGAAGQLTQAPTINIHKLTTKKARFAKRVYATAASVARIRLDFDGSTFENHDYHSGADQWERQEIEVDIPDAATQVKAICEVADGGTAYFDSGAGDDLFIDGHHIYKYTLPTTIVDMPTRVTEQYIRDHPRGPYYAIGRDNYPTKGRILLVEGPGILSQPTTDVGTIEVGAPHKELLLARARWWFWNTQANDLAAREVQRYKDLAADARAEYMEMVDSKRYRMAPPTVTLHPEWHYEEDASGKYIVFDVARDAIGSGFVL